MKLVLLPELQYGWGQWEGLGGVASAGGERTWGSSTSPLILAVCTNDETWQHAARGSIDFPVDPRAVHGR